MTARARRTGSRRITTSDRNPSEAVAVAEPVEDLEIAGWVKQLILRQANNDTERELLETTIDKLTTPSH